MSRNFTVNFFFGAAILSDNRFRMSPAAMNCGSRLSTLVVLSMENCDSESTHGARDLAQNCCTIHQHANENESRNE